MNYDYVDQIDWSQIKEVFAMAKGEAPEFPMNNFTPGRLLPPIGPLSVTIEEQKLPDLDARP